MLGRVKPATHSQVSKQSRLYDAWPEGSGAGLCMDSSPWSLGGSRVDLGDRGGCRGRDHPIISLKFWATARAPGKKLGRENISLSSPRTWPGSAGEVRAHRPDPKYSWLSGGWRAAPGSRRSTGMSLCIYLCACGMLEKVPSCIKKPVCVCICVWRTHV